MIKISDILEIIRESWKNSNTYILHYGEGLVLDPGAPRSEDSTFFPQIVLATHGHYDHLAGIDTWLSSETARFYFPEKDLYMLDNETSNASRFFAHPRVFPRPDILISNGDVISLGEGLELETWETPGHTQGSSCFLCSEISGQKKTAIALFSGDTFFADSIGRSDFDGGDPKAMRSSIESLRLRLAQLPETLPVFSGHGRASTVSEVLAYNPFFREGGFFGMN